MSTARSFLKGVLGRTPLGPPLRTWHQRRLAVKDVRNWTSSDEPALRFYSLFLKPADLCFDIGANRGMRTKVFRHLGARVVAVEPQNACMAILRCAFRRDPQVMLVQAACGAAKGQARMRVCDLDVLTSLSDEWITAVSASGRFAPGWTREEACAVVTADELIRTYGTPAFMKIDVEGYEPNVLKGLSRTVPCLSYEFTPERCEAAVECADRLCGLGFREFNVSWGESFELALDYWVPRDELVALLKSYREDTVIFGDVYARL